MVKDSSDGHGFYTHAMDVRMTFDAVRLGRLNARQLCGNRFVVVELLDLGVVRFLGKR